MSRFDPESSLAPLRDFQLATVNHVAKQFYREGTRRFLVADETGLGKSLVARGVIARTVEQLQDDDSVSRVDVVYVCSNADIAKQNVARLSIPGSRSLNIVSRLTLLIKHSGALKHDGDGGVKPVNLIAFTPGTSFDSGWRTGHASERAVLYILLTQSFPLSDAERRALLVIFEYGATRSFTYWRNRLTRELGDDPDPVIVQSFVRLIEAAGLDVELKDLAGAVGADTAVASTLRGRVRDLVGRLRAALAKASIDTLEPDLVILDEFQRFRQLLSVQEGGDSAELAQELFNYKQAKVLLLSATPYKPYTFAEESATGDNHHRDFVDLLRFLRPDADWLREVESGLRDYRSALVAGRPAAAAAAAVRNKLLAVMCRTERPALGQDAMLTTRTHDSTTDVEDLLGYAALRSLATELRAPATIEYWKSAPYFVNFMDGYVLGARLTEALTDPARHARLTRILARTQRLCHDDIRARKPVDPANGRLRALLTDCLADGQERLLWLPASLPYYQPAGPFADREEVTKRLVFSAWSATPTAVAALLSYEAERRLFDTASTEGATGYGDGRRRLEYRMDGGRPAAMTTLALFWPHPGLAARFDPLLFARTSPDRIFTTTEVRDEARNRLRAMLPTSLVAHDHGGDANPAQAYLHLQGALPAELTESELARGLAGTAGAEESSDGGDGDVGRGLGSHVTAAVHVARHVTAAARSAEDLVDDLAMLATHGPGNIAWRALARLVTVGDEVTAAGHWTAAAVLASGLRALFNRPESIALLDGLHHDLPYWRKVLEYCADGGLQATLDEYLHHLRFETLGRPLDDALLLDIAHTARSALTIRAVTYQAFDPDHPEERIGFPSRFAVRYGSQHSQHDSARPTEVRTAFNSPFWPFVLTTTSAGQEGIDFHWWSHALVHWNTPANPVDFEQREGRVHRYAGHAVRKNIAARHRSAILSAEDDDPWTAAFGIAAEHASEIGEFAPHWLYPGPARIERHLMPYTLSRDVTKTARLRDALAMYRLAFGQPRQEDLVDLLNQQNTSARSQPAIDLRPPTS
jgi:hypothetical protein